MINLYNEPKKESVWGILGIIFLVLILIVLAVLFPFAVVWALNTLFTTLLIPYNIWSWLAVVTLGLFNRHIVIKK